MNYKAIIENIQVEKSDYKYESQAIDQARGLDLLSSDVFSEYIRFLFELIQNADDAGATEVNIEVKNSYIIVSHNGDAFSEADVRSICSVGSGTKKSNTNTTGYKGIGFKSVFGKSNYVVIFSEGFQFRFDETYQHHKFKIMPWQIIPQWTEINDLQNDIRDSFPNTWKVSTIIRLEVTDEVLNDLSELLKRSQVLLFLRNLNKISAKGKLETVIEKKELEPGIVELIRNSTEKSAWLVKQFGGKLDEEIKRQLRDHRNPENRNIPEKVRFQENYEISYAAKIEKNRLVSLNEKETLIFTYLPTKVKSFFFPFLINSNFLVDTSRENLHEDNAWNQWLMKTAGEKVIEWIASLNNTKHSMEILHLLPDIRFSNGNKLNTKFFNSFIQYSKLKPFVPTEDGYLKTPTEILIDRTGLHGQDFISKEAIIEYINKVANKNYTVESFVNPKLESKSKLSSLGSYTFDLENLEDFFVDDIFKANHQPFQNFSLIKYFFEKSNNSNNRGLNEKLKELPFIYAKGKKLKSPRQLMFPILEDLDIEKDDEIVNTIPKIHKEVNSQIQNHAEIRLWLINLGVKETEDILEAIIENIGDIITEKNYNSITRFLFNKYKQGELVSHYRSLSNLKLLTKRNTFCQASDCYLSNFYEPIFKVEDYYEQGNYISHEYKEQTDLLSEWKTFFIRIGVSESISWIDKSFTRYELSSKYPKYFSEIPSGRPNSMYGIKNDFYRYDMNVISFIELTNNYSFSKTFWEIIFKNNISHYSYKSDMGICYYPTSLTPFNDWIIKNLAIFPTTQKKCLVASEVFINSRDNIEIGGKYLPVFDCNLFPSDNWSDYLPFKKVFELEDYLQVIDAIESDTLKDEELKNINKKRLGLIYNKLTSLIPNLSAKKKNIITEWAECHKLLCDNGNFENASELKWVKIEGFTNTSEHLKLLFIPENCETNTNDFEELLQLFGVQIIDSFIPYIKNKVPNATLKIQLQVILPFFTAIIERKHYLDYSAEFKRLSKIIDNTEFYNASEIVLSFKNQDEIILGPSLHAYLSDSELSFKGKWTSPITLYALIPELLKLFKLSGLSDELMLLIQLDENEIKQWLVEQGYELTYIEEKPEYTTAIEKVKSYTTEEETEQSFDLVDNSDERSRITISLEAKEIIFGKLRDKDFVVPNTLEINYTIVRGIKNPKGFPIKVVVKSGKAGKLYFNPSEWLALTEPDTQLFVVTRGNIVRNVTLEDLTTINDTFHMRFNTHAFAVNTNLKAFANFFRYLPYTHFIFDTPESTTDYLQQFGLSERNRSYEQLSDKDKQLYYSKDEDKTLH
jgi:hypothetical protein